MVQETGEERAVLGDAEAFGEDVGELLVGGHESGGEDLTRDAITQLVGVAQDVLRLLEGDGVGS